MTVPSHSEVFDLIDVSWPPETVRQVGPWAIRQDSSGSKRVMAASLVPGHASSDFEAAERAMSDLGQPHLFQILGDQAQLDATLDARGYAVIDRCTIYAGLAQDMSAKLAPATAWPVWPPLACQKEIWEAGGISEGRQAIMARAPMPKTAVLGRTMDTPVGAGFVSASGSLAMIHAVEVLSDYRRRGVARLMMHSAANWCVSQGVDWLALITTDDNVASNALYSNMGMSAIGTYHYRIKEPQ